MKENEIIKLVFDVGQQNNEFLLKLMDTIILVLRHNEKSNGK